MSEQKPKNKEITAIQDPISLDVMNKIQKVIEAGVSVSNKRKKGKKSEISLKRPTPGKLINIDI